MNTYSQQGCATKEQKHQGITLPSNRKYMFPLLSQSFPSKKIKNIQFMRDECVKNGVSSFLLGNDPFVWKYRRSALRAAKVYSPPRSKQHTPSVKKYKSVYITTLVI